MRLEGKIFGRVGVPSAKKSSSGEVPRRPLQSLISTVSRTMTGKAIGPLIGGFKSTDPTFRKWSRLPSLMVRIKQSCGAADAHLNRSFLTDAYLCGDQVPGINL